MARGQHTVDGLTAKQRAFVAARARGLNGVEAARAAGYAGTASSIASTASHLMRHEGVRAALRARGVSASGATRSRSKESPASRPKESAAARRASQALTRAQTTAVGVLIAGATHAEAAKAAKVSRETVSRWVSNHTGFRAELDAQRLAALERARLRVEGLADDALRVAAAVLTHAGKCADCSADIDAPSKDAQTMALAMLDRAGVGSRALDVPALRERMKSEAVGELADLLKSALPTSVYRQVLAVVRVNVVVGDAGGSSA